MQKMKLPAAEGIALYLYKSEKLFIREMNRIPS